jgi:hypothetical protein
MPFIRVTRPSIQAEMGDRALVLYYEELKADIAAQVKRIAEFLGSPHKIHESYQLKHTFIASSLSVALSLCIPLHAHLCRGG